MQLKNSFRLLRNIGIITLVIFFAPIGLPLMFKYFKRPSEKVKIIISIIWGVLWLGMMVNGIMNPSTETTSSNTANKQATQSSNTTNREAESTISEERPNETNTNQQQSVAPIPKYSFTVFVDWYSANKNSFVSKCSNADFTEEQSFACLQDVYKDYLKPELFTKTNENDRANLISAIARISAGVNRSGDENSAKDLYGKWAKTQ